MSISSGKSKNLTPYRLQFMKIVFQDVETNLTYNNILYINMYIYI